MERDERVFLLGEDIGVYGGAFKVTEGFIERFGPTRVMDTPIAEETIVGTALGAAMEGLRPVAEFQYADFMSSGFDEITTVLARYHYRTGVPLPVVLRGPSGGGVRASNFHSTNPEPWFAHAPGLKVICPAFPSDAKGLLKSAIRDDNPCVFLEHKWIYRRIKEIVSDDPDHLVPIGKADVKREGTDVSVIAHGMMVHLALEAAETLANEGISVEVVDLRTVHPLDEETVLRVDRRRPRARSCSTRATGSSGSGAEVAAMIAEKAFEHLDAPVVRLAPPNVPVPFSPPLEDAYLPQVSDIEDAVRRLSAWWRTWRPDDRRSRCRSSARPIVEGTILKWLKQEGDQVALDEPLFEISTDKVDTEVPSSAAGVLARIMVAEGETVAVGTELAEIDDGRAGRRRGSGAAARRCRRCGSDQPRPRPQPPVAPRCPRSAAGPRAQRPRPAARAAPGGGRAAPRRPAAMRIGGRGRRSCRRSCGSSPTEHGVDLSRRWRDRDGRADHEERRAGVRGVDRGPGRRRRDGDGSRSRAPAPAAAARAAAGAPRRSQRGGGEEIVPDLAHPQGDRAAHGRVAPDLGARLERWSRSTSSTSSACASAPRTRSRRARASSSRTCRS